MDRILADREQRRYWILQESVMCSEPVLALARNGERSEIDAY